MIQSEPMENGYQTLRPTRDRGTRATPAQIAAWQIVKDTYGLKDPVTSPQVVRAIVGDIQRKPPPTEQETRDAMCLLSVLTDGHELPGMSDKDFLIEMGLSEYAADLCVAIDKPLIRIA